MFRESRLDLKLMAVEGITAWKTNTAEINANIRRTDAAECHIAHRL